MMAPAIREAPTRPTDRREGAIIEPTRVECWGCESQGVTDHEINLCGCGRWFEVALDAVTEVDG